VSALQDSALEKYMTLLNKRIPFSFLKINHGFWDKLEPIELIESWPKSFEDAQAFAKTLNLSSKMMSDYINELMHLLELRGESVDQR